MNNRTTIPNVAAVLNALLETGVAVDTADKRNCTFLHNAARYGELKLAQVLISRGAKADAERQAAMTIKAYWTPLKYAFWYEKLEMMRLLLSSGANINHQPDYHQRTLLYECIFYYPSFGTHIPMPARKI